MEGYLPMSDGTTFPRLLRPPERSFFLFGPRGTGKSTWLRTSLKADATFDLLDASLYLELVRDPHRLEALCGSLKRGAWVVLDEVQKIPPLLDEVHRLVESRGWRFVLCGSSARKLRRGGVNLLGGRALTFTMEGLSAAELGDHADLRSMLAWGTLPAVTTDRRHAADLLSAYVHTYLREEIREEGLVRSTPPFMRFLAVAGLMNGQVLNASNIAREAAIPRATVDTYFSILEDTLVSHCLPAWRPAEKVRERAHPKFYWFDPGVARAAAGRVHDPVQDAWVGSALETLIFHELRVYNQSGGRHRPLSYYRTAAGVEVDFIVAVRPRSTRGKAHVIAIEVKAGKQWNRGWEKPLRTLAESAGFAVDRALVVYAGERTYRFGNVEGLPVLEFLRMLHAGDLY